MKIYFSHGVIATE